MESHDERMAEVIWEAHRQRAALRVAHEEMTALGLPPDVIRPRMHDLEDALLVPLLAEAEEVRRLAVEERDCRDRTWEAPARLPGRGLGSLTPSPPGWGGPMKALALLLRA